MKSTNYHNTLIEVAPDCPKATGTPALKTETVAGMQFELLNTQPYRLTSDDLLFEVYRRRNDGENALGRDEFFAKSQACLRASPLGKQLGWGTHHDDSGRVALVGVETERYRILQQDPKVIKVAAMRNKRAVQ
jgi:hypothetical protein